MKFDRNELAGAFGDIGTDFPLLVGMILAAGLDEASVLTTFGLMQILTGIIYKLPMPVQPLKAMATIVIVQKVPAAVLYGGGLAAGFLMLLLATFGLTEFISKVIPKPVIRGIQLGLGLQLSQLALKEYVAGNGTSGYVLAIVGFAIALISIGSRRLPAGLLLFSLAIIYCLVFAQGLEPRFGFTLPQMQIPTLDTVFVGLTLLALPQIPLSLANSILATRQAVEDLFPDRKLTVRQIALTYSLMNLATPFLGGVPVCHGCGGLAGHYAFGARTGGSVIIYGTFFVIFGLFFAEGSAAFFKLFPLPILGIMLLFESLSLMLLVRDCTDKTTDFALVLLVGLLAASLPYGYLVGMAVGYIVYKTGTLQNLAK
ncbi:MAG: putative sulfate/molybdate transporter [Acidobacteriota bacterium]|nr:putative sulfate/molybdate transporter [Blastocatellia bacterium]MDW8413805.1 putative sulfate/molybdate transporter [Acidobacteriota bacterium]